MFFDKGDNGLKKSKIIILIPLIIIISISLTGCHRLLPVEGKYASYNNFEQYKSDFEIIADIVMKHGQEYYYVDKENIELQYPVGSGADYHYERLGLSEEEKESLYNIVSNSHQQRMTRIIVRDNCVGFTEGDRHLGVVYTQEDIESAIKKIVEPYNDSGRYLYNELCENWYALYY